MANSGNVESLFLVELPLRLQAQTGNLRHSFSNSMTLAKRSFRQRSIFVVCRMTVDYISQTQEQQRFTVSELAADWHELMIPQHIMLPMLMDHWTHDAAGRHAAAQTSFSMYAH